MNAETKYVDNVPKKTFVFIAEDDPDIREGLQSALEDAGYEVLAAKDGRDALDLLDQTAALPQLIICNLMMPRLNGWELLKVLRAEDSRLLHVPALVLSAASESHALPPGVARAQKPIGLVEFLALVEHHTHRDAFLSPVGAVAAYPHREMR